jgi:hypothetical protein
VASASQAGVPEVQAKGVQVMFRYELGEFDREVFIESLRMAASLNMLKFIGQVMRIHKMHKLPHTLDKKYMHDCRIAYENRFQQLCKEKDKNGRQLRQQHDGDNLKERPKGKGDSSRLQRELRDRQQGVLDLGVDQGTQRWDREVSEFVV